MTTGVIVIVMVFAAVSGVIATKNIGMSSSEQMLLLLCEAGHLISDVVRRADKLMYEYKWKGKHQEIR